MGRIPDEDVNKVREATDVASLIGESIQLRRKGRLLWGLCPFHGEKTASFKVDPATQLWHCFGCGEGGDVFGFVMRTENVDFPDAVRILAKRANVEIHEEQGERSSRRERLAGACDQAAGFYHKVLTSSREAGAVAAREYLQGRGFNSEVAKQFQLGYAPGRGALIAHLKDAGFDLDEMAAADLALTGRGPARDRFYERVMFPIFDVRGRCIGFGGRVLGDGTPKYLNTGETPLFHKSEHLYGINWAKNAIVGQKYALVVEGYTDVIALHIAGLGNAVATLGTALTQQHMQVLARFAPRVVYLFDGDEAGMRAADRAVEMTDWRRIAEDGQKLELTVALIPGGKDPADYVAEEGADAMRVLIEGAVPLAQFALDRRMARHDLGTPEGRNAALAEAAAFLAPLGESLLGMDYRRYVAGTLMTDYDTVQLAVRKAPKEAPHRASSAGEAEESQAPVEVPAALTPQDRAETEVLRLLATAPELRFKARELLVADLLTSERNRTLVGLLAASEGLTGSDLYTRVREQDAEAAGVLTGVLVDERKPPQPDVAFDKLLTKLKEYALERQILQRNSEMRAAEKLKDRARYDELFREISALTIRLEELRSGQWRG